MNDNLERDPRRKQEIRCRPYADKLYKSILGEGISIQRFEHADDFILDKKFAMDVQITTPFGMIMTGQEKFLSAKYAGFKSITIEYMQDPTTNEQGDWFKMAVQFYFVGYEYMDTFKPWIIIDWTAMVLATLHNEVDWYNNNNQDGRAKANFKYCLMLELPPECIIAASQDILERRKQLLELRSGVV